MNIYFQDKNMDLEIMEIERKDRMKNTIKVNELLNKIANNEKVPNKVKYGPYYWEYDEENNDYLDNDDDYVFSCSNYDIIKMLNKDVEIIEEPQEHKIPEKLPYYSLEKIQKVKNKDEWREEIISLLEERIDDYHNKINEIIDYLEVNKDE